MRDYGKVYTAFWTSEDVLGMTEDERTLALYLLTCPHGNMLGCFRLPEAYASDDLKWVPERVSKGFAGLVAKGYIYRCERSSWLVILRYLKWNQFENPNVGKAAGKLFESLSAPMAAKAALTLGLREFSPTFPNAILAKFDAESKPFGNPFELSPETGAVTGTGIGTGNITSANPAAVAPQSPDLDLDMPPGKQERRKTPRYIEADRTCAQWLYDRILLNNPDHKPPKLEVWADEVRLMREQDSRTHREICELFGWVQGDGFWRGVILSPSKLREKWDQLTMLRARPKAGEGGTAAWWFTDQSVIAKGAELGIAPRAGESMAAFKGRIQVAIDQVTWPPTSAPLPAPAAAPVVLKRSIKPEGLDLKALLRPAPELLKP